VSSRPRKNAEPDGQPAAAAGSCAGFTLLEVLLAFTIAALVLGAVLQVFAGGLRGSVDAKEYAVAALLARSRLAALAADTSGGEGIATGEDDGGYRWRIEVDRLPEEGAADAVAAGFAPQRVTVSVAWDDDGGSGKSVTLTTMRLVPLPDRQDEGPAAGLPAAGSTAARGAGGRR
jgi:general secretion pathway protein I